jgi:hypothetical protein
VKRNEKERQFLIKKIINMKILIYLKFVPRCTTQWELAVKAREDGRVKREGFGNIFVVHL